MFWKRRSPAVRPDDDAVMAALRRKVAESEPGLTAGTRARDGMLVGRTGWALMMLPNHTGSPSHFDVGFAVSLNAPGQVVLADCISGLGEGAGAVESMTHVWRETSGACFLEILTARGDYASRLSGSDSAGLAGWHCVVSGVIGYGVDSAANDLLQKAMLDNEVLRALSPVLAPALDQSSSNGVKIFLFRSPESTVAEVRINGLEHEACSEALAALPWPEVSSPAIARCYAVAVHPESQL